MRSTGETAPSLLSSINSFYQVPGPELWQRREPTVQHVVSPLVSAVVASHFHLQVYKCMSPVGVKFALPLTPYLPHID
jgi:hypothetical protein